MDPKRRAKEKSKPKAAPSYLFTNEDAAAYLGITTRTLDVWRCKQRYPISFIKVGSLIRYRKEHLDAWLESRTHHAEATG
jgi:excisionase family DNA binding protein